MGMFTTTSFERRIHESVATGDSHVVVAQPNGTVTTWGSNGSGQLGGGTTGGSSSMAVQVVTAGGLVLHDIIAVAAGGSSSLALRVDGTVWAWGSNGSGQLGNGNYLISNVATQVEMNGGGALTGIRSIAAGDSWSGAIDDAGRVWMWGSNSDRQLGRNDTASQNRARTAKESDGTTDVNDAMAIALGPALGASGGRETIIVTAHGALRHWGAESATPVGYTGHAVIDANGVKFLAMGGTYMSGGTRYAVTANGQIAVWGENSARELGDNSGTDRAITADAVVNGMTGAVAVAAGSNYGLALRHNGEVHSWGTHLSGGTGRNTTASYSATPQRVYKNGAATNEDPRTMVIAGPDFSLSLGADSKLRSWGQNALGQLGTGNTTPRTTAGDATSYDPDVGFTAIQGTYGNIAALRSDGTVWTAGNNTVAGWGAGVGLLGTGSTSINATDRFFRITSPAAFNGSITRIGPVLTRDHYTFTATGTDASWYAWGWGSNSSDSVNRRLGTSVAASADHMSTPRLVASNVIQGSVSSLQAAYLDSAGVPTVTGYRSCKGTAAQWWISPSGSNPQNNAGFAAWTTPLSMTSLLSGLQTSYGRSGLGQPLVCGLNEAGVGSLGLTAQYSAFMRQPAIPGSSCPTAGTSAANCRDSASWATDGAIQVHGGGDDAYFALSANGSVRGWGSNFDYYGSRQGNGTNGGFAATPTTVKLSGPSDISGVVAIGGGDGTGFGVRSDGRIYTWGQNSGESGGFGQRCGLVGGSDWADLVAGSLIDDAVGGTIVGDSGLHVLSASGRITACGKLDVATARGACGTSASSRTPVGVGCPAPAPTTPALNASVFNVGDNVRFTFQAQDPDAGDYLKPWVQVVPTSGTLSSTECGDHAATWYTGAQVQTPVANTNVGMQVDVTTLPLGSYKWQACVRDTFGNASPYLAGSGTFSVGDVFPPSPTPATGSGAALTSTSIRWTMTAPTDQGSGIVLPVGLHADAYSFDGGATWQTSAQFDETSLNPNTWYGPISIRTRDANGNETAVGSITAVRTPPAAPGSRVTSNHTATSVDFGWAASAGADQYRLRVYSDGSCATPIGTDPVHTTAATTLSKSTGLAVDRSYWYTLEARSSTTGQWGDASACTALSAANGRTSLTVSAPASVSLGSLLPGASNTVDATVSVTTNQSPGYELFVATDGLLRSGALNIPGLATGTVGTPLPWSGSGFGMTVLNGPGSDDVSRWGSGANWALLPGSSTSMYDSGALATGSDLTTQVDVRFRVDVPAAQTAASYSMTTTFTAVGKL